MSETVLISTHRLPVAGALREAFRAEGFRVELIPTVGHLPETAESGDAEPVLLVLTGLDEGAAWARTARDVLEVPLFTNLPETNAVELGVTLGAEEAFAPDVQAAEVALVGRRAVERRKLQELIGIVGESEAMRELLERVVQMAPVDSTVLVTGESGTGKELVARGIHHLSPRRHKAFLAVNVAALSDTLLESELFGHEKGAFTGAIDSRRGFFELANRGTLFLDEIGEMPMSTQTKLLRVLEQREFLRVGGESPIRVDVRIVAATNRELREMVRMGEFRRDLYYRLNILDLRLPPLRERPEDVPVLVKHFIREISERMDRPFPGISAEAMRLLQRHPWPGNVRELRNLVESMVVMSPGREIGPDDIPAEIRKGKGGVQLLPRPTSVYGSPLGEGRGGPEAGTGRAPPAFETVSDRALTRRMPMVPDRRASAGSEDRDNRSGDEGARREGGDGSGEGGREQEAHPRRIQPELEFVFRTLMDLKVDMEELRREFEVYRDEVDHRLDDPGPGVSRSLPPGIEVGIMSGVRSPYAEVEDGVDGGDEGNDVESESTIVFHPGMTIEEMEAQAIESVLEQVDGNRRKAAESLGIGERTLYRKIRRYGIDL